MSFNILSMASSAFEIQFPGDRCPVGFVPGGGKDRIGALTSNPEWATQEDDDFFEEIYPRMRPGLVLAQVNGEDVIYLDFDSIMTMVEEAEQPRHFLFIERESKWNIVRRKLHFIATKLRQKGDGVTKAEREWRLQVHMNILHYASKANIKEFNFWMTRVSDIDFQDASVHKTALHYSCESGCKEIVTSLLKRNVDLYLQDAEGRTALHAAVRRGHEPVTKLLLACKAAVTGDLVNTPDYQNRMPIHEAAIGGNMGLMHRLLKAGANFDVKETTWSFLPIHFAAANGHEDMVKWLIDHGGQSVRAETKCKREPLDFSDGCGWNQVTRLLQRQMEGEPIHCVLTRERQPWVPQSDSAMSPKAKRNRDRVLKAKRGRGWQEEELYDRDGKLIVVEIKQCERVYLGDWHCLNKWWLDSRGISAVVTLLDIDEFGEKTVRQRGKRSKVTAMTARAVRFSYRSLKEWKERGGGEEKEGEGKEEEGKVGGKEEVEVEVEVVVSSDEEEEEEELDLQPRQHYHISVPNRFKKGKDWSKLLSSLPSFSRVFDPLVSSGDYPRVLVVGFDYQASATAIASWMMTRRGMERENKGLPFFRCEESIQMLRDSLPEGAVPDGGVDSVLRRLQAGLDRRRQTKLNERVADLFKVI